MPESKLKEGNAVAIRCAHGDTVLYPLADITMEVNGRQITVEAGVSETLPMSVLLGIDNPELVEMLQVNGKEEIADGFAVTTRAEAKKNRAEEAERQRREKASGVRPTSLGEVLPTWIKEMR